MHMPEWNTDHLTNFELFDYHQHWVRLPNCNDIVLDISGRLEIFVHNVLKRLLNNSQE